jgi:hypothetical protein
MASVTAGCVGLAACGGGGGGGGTAPDAVRLAADVNPVSSGDVRLWRVVSGARTGTERSEIVEAAITVDGRLVLPIRASDGVVEYVERAGDAWFEVAGPESGALAVAFGRVETLRTGVAAGEVVRLIERTATFDYDGDGRNDDVTLVADAVFVRNEPLTTALESHAAASRVRTAIETIVRFGGGGESRASLELEEWFVPGIGRVRVQSRAGGATDVEDLVAYGVGSRRSESQPPSIVSVEPADGATLRPPDVVRVRFSEPLEPQRLADLSSVALQDAAGVEVPATRSIAPDRTSVSFDPRSRLPDGRYTLRFSAALTDNAGNPLAAASTTFVVDDTKPRIVGATPAINSTGAPTTGEVAITFDEPVFAVDGTAPTIRIWTPATSTLAATEQLLPASITGARVSATIATPLAPGLEHRMEVNTPLRDTAGNVLNNPPTVRFTTAP